MLLLSCQATLLDHISIAPTLRLEEFRRVVEPFSRDVPDVWRVLHDHRASLDADKTMEAALRGLVSAGHVKGVNTVVRLVSGDGRMKALVFAANHNQAGSVEALAPFTNKAVAFSALQSYMGVIHPRDPRIFEVLWPHLDLAKHAQSLFDQAIFRGHMELAQRMVAHCAPWKTCAKMASLGDPAQLQPRIDQVWSQSILEGQGPLPSRTSKRAWEWANKLPSVSSAIAYLKINECVEVALSQPRTPGRRL